MELKSQFAEFMTNIRPTSSQQDDWKVGSRTLRSRLDNDEELKKIVVATFLQGSIRRSTAVRPTGDKRPDIDIVVVTNIDHNKLSPQEAMDLFEPFLEKHYKGKWRPQGRSFGIELSYVDLDLVITALPADTASRSSLENLYKSTAVLTTNSLEEDTDWRLNRNWSPSAHGGLFSSLSQLNDAPQEEWKPHPLYLPDRDAGTWGKTHPLAQIQWTAAKNRSCNGHYINLVKAVKWWRQINADALPRYPKGYPLEHMIGFLLSDGTLSMASGLVQVLENFRETWRTHALLHLTPTLSDHGVPEHNVLSRLSGEDFTAFYNAVCEAAALARQALDSTDATESGKLWQELLGSKFPLPGPQGGDRSGGSFTPPAEPARPEQSGRFA